MPGVLIYSIPLIENGTASSIDATSGAVVRDVVDWEQSYFWTSTWQGWEKEADEDLLQGRYKDFDTLESLFKDLDKE